MPDVVAEYFGAHVASFFHFYNSFTRPGWYFIAISVQVVGLASDHQPDFPTGPPFWSPRLRTGPLNAAACRSPAGLHHERRLWRYALHLEHASVQVEKDVLWLRSTIFLAAWHAWKAAVSFS